MLSLEVEVKSSSLGTKWQELSGELLARQKGPSAQQTLE